MGVEAFPSSIVPAATIAKPGTSEDFARADHEHKSRIVTGTGSPNGVIARPVGYLYLRLDGGANTTLYVKESGTGNTGWVAK